MAALLVPRLYNRGGTLTLSPAFYAALRASGQQRLKLTATHLFDGVERRPAVNPT